MTNMDIIMAALSKTAVEENEEENKSQEECGIVNCNPDYVDAFGRDLPEPYYDEDETYDEEDTSEYDSWVEDTWSSYDEAGDVSGILDTINNLCSELEDIKSDLYDDDTRYYDTEHDNLREAINELRDVVSSSLKDAIESLRQATSEYTAY